MQHEKSAQLYAELNWIRGKVKLWKWGHADKPRKGSFSFVTMSYCMRTFPIKHLQEINENVVLGLSQTPREGVGVKSEELKMLFPFVVVETMPRKCRVSTAGTVVVKENFSVQNICKKFSFTHMQGWNLIFFSSKHFFLSFSEMQVN